MDKQQVVLLVDDNKNILDANRRILEKEGLEILAAATLAEARLHLKQTSPDVVVLDIMLPDGSGLDFMPELRETCSAPVLFLTAKGKQGDRLAGFRARGNDYISKPYDIDEFRERVLSFLRLEESRKSAESLEFGPLTLNLISGQAFFDDKDLLLSTKEFHLLLFLMQNKGYPMSARQCYEQVWGQPMNEDTDAIKVRISQLRKKLEGSGYTITAEWGRGYLFEES